MVEQNGFEPLPLGFRHKSTALLSSQLSYCSVFPNGRFVVLLSESFPNHAAFSHCLYLPRRQPSSFGQCAAWIMALAMPVGFEPTLPFRGLSV